MAAALLSMHVQTSLPQQEVCALILLSNDLHEARLALTAAHLSHSEMALRAKFVCVVMQSCKRQEGFRQPCPSLELIEIPRFVELAAV